MAAFLYSSVCGVKEQAEALAALGIFCVLLLGAVCGVQAAEGAPSSVAALLRQPTLQSPWRPAHLQVFSQAERPHSKTLLHTAQEFLGMPYVWGGTGSPGFDCSGFVNAVYARHGYDIPRVSRDQFKVGFKTSRKNLRRGDLLFFVSKPGAERISHVGMYVGEGVFIHAARGKGEVSYDKLSSRYYAKRYAGARHMLKLPPGRYSTSWGAAPARLLFNESYQLDPGFDPVLVELGMGMSGDDPLARAFGLRSSGDVPQEHVAAERQLQLATTLVKGALAHVGPQLFSHDDTHVTGRLGVGSMGQGLAVVGVPEFTYFGHDNALRVVLGVPFRLNPDTQRSQTVGEAFTEGWNTARDWSRVIREVRFGHKEAQLFVDLSRTASGSLGHGQLMRYYTPNTASRFLPNYGLEADALSLSFDTYNDRIGVEAFIDDVFSPHVFGVLGFVRPAALFDWGSGLARKISLGFTYAMDHDAPLSMEDPSANALIHGFGFDMEGKLYKTPLLDLKAYADVSALMTQSTRGVGGALGVLLRANVQGARTHVFRMRMEMRMGSGAFVPSYFGMFYGLSRQRVPADGVGEALHTKLQLLQMLDKTSARWGVFAEAIYHMHRRVSIGLSYEDAGAMLGETPQPAATLGRGLMVFAKMRKIYLPGSTRALSFQFAYHLRNFSSARHLFSQQRGNEYFFAALRMQLWRAWELGIVVRKSGAQLGDTEARFDGMLDLAFRYQV